MFKKFFSYTAAEGLSKALNWLTIAILPLVLAPKEYGLVGLLVAIEGVVSTITLIGQEKAIFRFYNPSQINVLKYSLQLVTLFVLILIAASCGIYISRQQIFGIAIFPHLLVFIISILFYNQARLLMAISRITDNPGMFWKTRALYQVIKIVAVFALAFWRRDGLCYIYGCFIAGLIFVIIYIKLIASNYKPIRNIIKFDKHAIMLLSFGVPLIFHAMSGNILSYADRFFVNGYLNSRQLGVYTFVYSLGSSIFFFYGTVASYFEPLTYKYHNNKNSYQVVLKFYLIFVLLFAGVMALLIQLAFKPLILPMVSKDYGLGYDCLKFILAAHLLIPFYTIANYELAVINRTKFIATSTVLSAIFNLTLNFFIIPKIGITGAAISTFLTYFFLSIVSNIWARVKAGKDLNYLSFIAVTFVVVLGFLMLLYLSEHKVLVEVLIAGSGFAILAVFLLSLFRKLKVVLAEKS